MFSGVMCRAASRWAWAKPLAISSKNPILLFICYLTGNKTERSSYLYTKHTVRLVKGRESEVKEEKKKTTSRFLALVCLYPSLPAGVAISAIQVTAAVLRVRVDAGGLP